MTQNEFQNIYPHVIAWIRQTLATHAGQSKPISSLDFKRLPQYFSEALLRTAHFIPVERVPVPPLSAIGLTQFADYERGEFDGITYLDTFFVKQNRVTDESLHFHELIHVVQWRLLGPERFLAVYAAGLEARGYRNSPLEVMAYDATAIFDQTRQPFDAEELVAKKLAAAL